MALPLFNLDGVNEANIAALGAELCMALKENFVLTDTNNNGVIDVEEAIVVDKITKGARYDEWGGEARSREKFDAVTGGEKMDLNKLMEFMASNFSGIPKEQLDQILPGIVVNVLEENRKLKLKSGCSDLEPAAVADAEYDPVQGEIDMLMMSLRSKFDDVDEDYSGALEPEELVKMFSGFFNGLEDGPCAADVQAKAEAVIAAYDTNGDGKLQFAEFVDMMDLGDFWGKFGLDGYSEAARQGAVKKAKEEEEASAANAQQESSEFTARIEALEAKFGKSLGQEWVDEDCGPSVDDRIGWLCNQFEVDYMVGCGEEEDGLDKLEKL